MKAEEPVRLLVYIGVGKLASDPGELEFREITVGQHQVAHKTFPRLVWGDFRRLFMSRSQPFDIWQPQHDAIRHGDAVGQNGGPDLSILNIETITDVQPLDTQIGGFPKQTVPTKLRDVVFGEPAPSDSEINAASGDPAAGPRLNTYAILDGAGVSNLPEILENSGLEHRFLFRGETIPN